jgi:putative transcriptional regulator
MREVLRSLRLALVLAGAALVAAPLTSLQAADPESSTVMLVAKPQLQHPLYSSTILIAKPLQNGGHAGFILNKPTKMTLGDAFPDDEPSQKVAGPIFLGGPVNTNIIFALVKRDGSPGPGAIQLTPDLFLAMASETVDGIIQREADHARFYAGAVVWQPGELREEMNKGAWYVLDPDAEVVLRKDTHKLWEDMVTRSETHARMM